MNTGKVWLVGAGPGDVGLLTLKGKRVLDEAQVVVYDSLVGEGILAMIPQEARAINVGKRAGNHTMPQEEINRVLLREAQAGNRVVRLKGGDPFVFGRGGEELELLEQYDIPYEIVPGITSAVAVPAYNGIPVTHRDFCSSLHIITGHKRAGEGYNINFEALVRTEGTLVFLMGLSSLGDICAGLIEAGMDPFMPAAVLQKGATARQKRVIATVATLKEEADAQGIEAPAIIVIGRVCELAERFAWYEELPLAGTRVLVTRPKKRASSMAECLRRQGAEVLELPAIETRKKEDMSALQEAICRVSEYRWIAFTSPAGVEVFCEELLSSGKDMRALSGCRIAAIGNGTAKALIGYGILADLVPEHYDGESLGRLLAQQAEPDAKILLPRAAIGSEGIIRCLAERKDLTVDDIPVYDTVYPKQEAIDEASLFKPGGVDIAVFTSASTVKGFAEATAGMDWGKVTAACIGAQTAAAAERLGMKTYVAKQASIDSVVNLVIQLSRAEKGL